MLHTDLEVRVGTVERVAVGGERDLPGPCLDHHRVEPGTRIGRRQVDCDGGAGRGPDDRARVGSSQRDRGVGVVHHRAEVGHRPFGGGGSSATPCNGQARGVREDERRRGAEIRRDQRRARGEHERSAAGLVGDGALEVGAGWRLEEVDEAGRDAHRSHRVVTVGERHIDT